jgi:methyl-accepting chemotaxis protein
MIVVFCLIFYSYQKSNIEQEEFLDEYKILVDSLQKRLEKKADIGVTNALSFASSREILDLVRRRQRDGLFDYTKRIGGIFRVQSNFKGIRLQLFDNNKKTLIRSWKEGSYGDISPAVLELLEETQNRGRALSAFVLDDDGLLLRGAATVGDKDDPVGFIQYIQGVGSISRDYEKEGRSFIQLIKTTTARDLKAVKDNPTLGGYTLASNKWFSKDVVKRLSNIDFSRLGADPYFLSDGLFVVVEPVYDIKKQVLGYFVLGEPESWVMQKVQTAMQASQYFIVVMVLGFLLIFTIVFAVLRRKVLTPLSNIKHFAEEVAGGSWTAQPKGRYFFELAALKDSLLRMVHELETAQEVATEKSQEALKAAHAAQCAAEDAELAKAKAEVAKNEGVLFAVQELMEIVNVIGAASEALMEEIEQSREGAHDQSERIATSASAMEQMNASVLEIAKSSHQGAESANEAMGKANMGNEIVHSVVQSINEVHKIALSLKEDMALLGRQASGIGQIVNVISDIADQTNLLALNAAIEAARAGEAGRGFAVVADEVRKLAEKTQDATKEVEGSVSAIQASTLKNVTTVEKAAETIQSANEQAVRSGESLEEIVHHVDDVSGRMSEIATASEQQSKASAEISSSIEYIHAISEKTVDIMNASAHGVEKLTEQTLLLRNIICGLEGGCK